MKRSINLRVKKAGFNLTLKANVETENLTREETNIEIKHLTDALMHALTHGSYYNKIHACELYVG